MKEVIKLAKNKSTAKKTFDVNMYFSDDLVKSEDIGELNKSNMIIYGANVNLARMIPDVRDGLKPVERRIIYTMYEFSKAKKDFKKVQKITGDCMSTVHPHGDSSIYETLVRLAQPWNNMICPIEISGNFGNIAGEEAAAGRYISARLTPYSLDCFFSDYDTKVMEMKESFQPGYYEPEYFVTKYPNMLMSISSGIGYGVYNGIPTFNIAEILQYTIDLINDPSTERVLYPDMPTGCQVIDDGNFGEICRTGTGSFRMRADIEIDEDAHKIVISSIPFNASLIKIKQSIKDLIDSKKIIGFKDMRNYSCDVIDLELIFKPEADLNHIVNLLYTKTDLQKTFPVRLIMINDYVDKCYTLKSALLEWIDIRRLYKNKYYIGQLVKLEERAHLLDILIFILNKNNAEKTMKIIKESSRNEIEERLVKEYKISSIQAKKIANMKFSDLSKDARAEYKKEAEEIPDKIKELKKILTNTSKIDKIIIKELEEGISKYGIPRKSKVIKASKLVNIPNTEHSLAFTKNGYVKKLPYKADSIGNVSNNDSISKFVPKINNRDDVIIFDNKGMCHSIKVSDIEPTECEEYGVLVSRYVKSSNTIISAIPKSKLLPENYLIFVTAKGMVKKSKISDYGFKTSSIAISLSKDDFLVKVIQCSNKDMNILMYTRFGMGLLFNTSEITPVGRMAKGVIGLKMTDNDFVCGVTSITSKDKYIFILTSNGRGKKVKTSLFKEKGRRSESGTIITLSGDERLVCCRGVNDKSTVVIYLQKYPNVIIPATDIPTKIKIDSGDELFNYRKSDSMLQVVVLNNK